jgi:protoporphyrin/coproporphyrin ferrochelatase
MKQTAKAEKAGPRQRSKVGARAGDGRNRPADHPAIVSGRIGVLLVNLGTPDGYDRRAMRRYLAEFLTDSRVIEWPRALWYPFLYGIVLNTRPRKSGKAYAAIWNRERNESPLRTFTRSQAEKLSAALADLRGLAVDWAMRYGRPAIGEKLGRLKDEGCERIVVFPLYPQYSATTTATVNDKVFEVLSSMRWMPAARIVPPYHDDPVYIERLARSITRHLETLDFEPEKFIASYHGIPASYFRKGDPYYCHCQKTSRLLAERLGWTNGRLLTCFQSRFGPQEWLQPYTDETIVSLARQGVRRIAVFNPGFVSDCLETLEEIAVEARATFLQAGGQAFSHIPCLNDGEDGMAVIEAVVRRELSGWV